MQEMQITDGSDSLRGASSLLAARFGRLELIAEHSEEVLANARKLVQAELKAIRLARVELSI
jgi:hypothetical protein